MHIIQHHLASFCISFFIKWSLIQWHKQRTYWPTCPPQRIWSSESYEWGEIFNCLCEQQGVIFFRQIRNFSSYLLAGFVCRVSCEKTIRWKSEMGIIRISVQSWNVAELDDWFLIKTYAVPFCRWKKAHTARCQIMTTLVSTSFVRIYVGYNELKNHNNYTYWIWKKCLVVINICSQLPKHWYVPKYFPFSSSQVKSSGLLSASNSPSR